MLELQPRYSKEEFARRGDEIYERDIRPQVEAGDEGKFVVIDIETGAYEIDADELAASDRLHARLPNAQVWLRRLVPATLAASDHVNIIFNLPRHDNRRRHCLQ